jgi:hypothetical protein
MENTITSFGGGTIHDYFQVEKIQIWNQSLFKNIFFLINKSSHFIDHM